MSVSAVPGALSVKEILELGPMAELVAISGQVSADATETRDQLAEMYGKGPNKDKAVIQAHVDREASRALFQWSRHWRISRSQLIRLCLHRVGSEFGFDVTKVLGKTDTLWERRVDGVPKPFMDREDTLKIFHESKRASRVFSCDSPRRRRMECPRS